MRTKYGTMAAMNVTIPTAAEIRARLTPLTRAQMIDLARVASVPFTTLLKIRNGETENPRIDTVRQFFDCIDDFVPPTPKSQGNAKIGQGGGSQGLEAVGVGGGALDGANA